VKHHREEIYKTFTEYFDIVGSKQISDIGESLELFNKYICPLANLFIDLRGFRLAPKPWVVLLWTLFVSVVLCLFDASLYFYLGLLVVTILIIVRQLYYSKKAKTYGFMY
jgi:hypothetical protein